MLDAESHVLEARTTPDFVDLVDEDDATLGSVQVAWQSGSTLIAGSQRHRRRSQLQSEVASPMTIGTLR